MKNINHVDIVKVFYPIITDEINCTHDFYGYKIWWVIISNRIL